MPDEPKAGAASGPSRSRAPDVVRLDYGASGLDFRIPGNAAVCEVVRPRFPPPVESPEKALRDALRFPISGPPLRERVPEGAAVAVSVCDGTRPQPRIPMLRAILDEIPVPPERVAVLIATGTHRGPDPAAVEAMLGSEIASACEVVVHDCRETDALVRRPDTSNGVPVLLHRRFVEADVRIATGFVEPHFFAGFSGGPKMVAPGLAGLETILVLHDAARVGHPNATFGITVGNPIHDDVREIAAGAAVDFSLDVLLDGQKRITAAFGGDLSVAHPAACRASRVEAMRPLDAPHDVVVTTNSGWPLDQNLYQAVKGMAAAARVARPGGRILAAAECRAGIPDGGAFARALHAGASAAEVEAALRAADRRRPDDWQVQVYCGVLERARVGLRSGLAEGAVRAAHLEPVGDPEAWCAEALREAGPDARLLVLPHGPITIPYLADASSGGVAPG